VKVSIIYNLTLKYIPEFKVFQSLIIPIEKFVNPTTLTTWQLSPKWKILDFVDSMYIEL